MIRRLRIKKAHARFLEASRTLSDAAKASSPIPTPIRWLIELLSPVPLLGLHEEGQKLFLALTWLEQNCKARRLDQSVILTYHKLACPGTPTPGIYRKHPMTVEQSAIPRRPAESVPPGMKKLESDLQLVQDRLDGQGSVDEEELLEHAVEVHYRIGLLHPFSDGNGRVARLSMNHFFRRYGGGYLLYPHLGAVPEFWDALQEAHQGQRQRLLRFASSCRFRI